MRVAQRVAFFVADGLEELVDPDGGVDCEAFAVEGWEGSGTSGGREDGPEACYSHFEGVRLLLLCLIELRGLAFGVEVGSGGFELKASRMGDCGEGEEARTSCTSSPRICLPPVRF